MFGYVVINKPDMRFKDFDVYQSYYCGLCRELKAEYGLKGQLTLNYDLTFLSILLSGLYEPETTAAVTRCIAHPFEQHRTLRNECSRYAAEMNVLLTYYKCLDDWSDDHKFSARVMSSALKKSGQRVSEKYPDKASVIRDELNKLAEYEKAESNDIDAVSGCFGRIMAEVFTYRTDEWTQTLSRMGFYLGKYIYILDAYTDYDEDMKKGRYNPLGEKGHDVEYIREMLTMMMAQCSAAYDFLPIVESTEILDNIIYSGVWSRFIIPSEAQAEIHD